MKEKLPPQTAELDPNKPFDARIMDSRKSIGTALSAHQIDVSMVISKKIDVKDMTDRIMSFLDRYEPLSDAAIDGIRALFEGLFSEFNKLVPFSRNVDGKLGDGILSVSGRLDSDYKSFNIARFKDLENQISIIFGRMSLEGGDYISDQNGRITNDFIGDVNNLLNLMLNSWNAYEARYMPRYNKNEVKNEGLSSAHNISPALRNCILGVEDEENKKVTAEDVLAMIEKSGWSTPFTGEIIGTLIKEAGDKAQMKYVNTEDIADETMEQIMQFRVLSSIRGVADGSCDPKDAEKELKAFIAYSMEHKRNSIAGQKLNSLRSIQKGSNPTQKEDLEDIEIVISALARCVTSLLPSVVQNTILQHKKP
jgi:hypothetical protein